MTKSRILDCLSGHIWEFVSSDSLEPAIVIFDSNFSAILMNVTAPDLHLNLSIFITNLSLRSARQGHGL